MEEKNRQRIIVHFYGRVQGVGFRATAYHIAKRYKVTGYVRNLRDGSVELCIDGDEKEAQSFISDLENEFKGYIEGKELSFAVAKNPYTSFFIAY